MDMIFLFCGSRLNSYDLSWIDRSEVKICAIMNNNFYESLSGNAISKCDEVIIVNTKSSIGYLFESDFQEVIGKINNILVKYNLNQIKVVCSYEGDVSLSCKVREYFGLSGMTYKDSLLFRDKIQTKEFLYSKGINVPKFIDIDLYRLVTDHQYFSYVIDSVGLPFIIKPTSSGGGYGVHKIASRDDIAAVKDVLINDISLKYEAEAFLTGKLYHCDIVMQNGCIIFAECCIYNHQYYGFEKHVVIGSASLDDNLEEKQFIIDYCSHIIKVMGTFDGAYHCEVFKELLDITLLEIGMRPAGGAICDMYDLMYEINLLDLNLAVQADLEYGKNLYRKFYGVWAIFFNYAPIKLKDKYYVKGISPKYTTWYFKKGSQISENNVIGRLLYKHKQSYFTSHINELMADFQPFSIE